MADTDTVNVGCTHPLGMRLGVYEWDGEGDTRVLKHVGDLDIVGNGGGPDVFTAVPADMFAKWMELNKDTDLVRNGEVFTQGKAKAA